MFPKSWKPHFPTWKQEIYVLWPKRTYLALQGGKQIDNIILVGAGLSGSPTTSLTHPDSAIIQAFCWDLGQTQTARKVVMKVSDPVADKP